MRYLPQSNKLQLLPAVPSPDAADGSALNLQGVGRSEAVVLKEVFRKNGSHTGTRIPPAPSAPQSTVAFSSHLGSKVTS